MISNEKQLAISQLYGLYADAIHRLDANAWSHCWTTDAQWSIASLENPTTPMLIQGRENILQTWQSAMTAFKHVQHMLHSHHIFALNDNKTLLGRSYLSESFHFEGDYIELFGLYQDVFLEVDSQWRFQSRKFSILQLKRAHSVPLYFDYPDLDLLNE
jgi:hypothetical protein